MQWHSLNDFLSMGGYALYVWGSFGVTAGAMLIEAALLRRRRHEAVRGVRRQALIDGDGSLAPSRDRAGQLQGEGA